MPKTKAKDCTEDVTQLAARLIRAVTRTEVTPGEDLMGDPETRRLYVEAKQKEAERQRKVALKRQEERQEH